MGNKKIVWTYNKPVDITIGEVATSKTSKIILIIILSLLTTIAVFGIYFRQEIYDYITNPDIILVSNSIDLDVHSEFDPENYIAAKSPYVSNIRYENLENVDVHTLGTYVVTYISYNSTKSNTHDLTINIIDREPPVIKLTSQLAMLTHDSVTSFDAKSYIQELSDNYTSQEDLILEISGYDWSKDIFELTYTVKDEVGLESYAMLNVIINPEGHMHEWDDGRIVLEPSYDADGIKEYTCKTCGQKYKETLPRLQPTPEPTITPSPKPGITSTPRPTATPTTKPTNTAKPTATPTNKPTNTPKPTPTPTPKPTNTPKPTPTPTPKPTPTPTPKPTPTPTPKPSDYYITLASDTITVTQLTPAGGTTTTQLVSLLQSNLTGYNGPITIDYSHVNLTVVGKYTAYYKIIINGEVVYTKTCAVQVVAP